MQVLSGDELHMFTHTQTCICTHSFDFQDHFGNDGDLNCSHSAPQFVPGLPQRTDPNQLYSH